MEELFYKNSKVYVFRVTLKKFKGWSHYAEDLVDRGTKYMGEVNNLKFTPSNKK